MTSDAKGRGRVSSIGDMKTNVNPDELFTSNISPPVALLKHQVTSSSMTFSMLQHHSITNGDWTAVDLSTGNAMLKVEGKALNWSNLRSFKDQTGSLFQLRRKVLSRNPSWYLNVSGESERIMKLEWNPTNFTVEMAFPNQAQGISEKQTKTSTDANVVLKAKGTPGNGYTTIHRDNQLIGEVRRPHETHRGTGTTMLTGENTVYECRAAGGLDWKLVALVAVLMSDLTDSGRNSLFGHVGGGPGGLPGAGFAL